MRPTGRTVMATLVVVLMATAISIALPPPIAAVHSGPVTQLPVPSKLLSMLATQSPAPTPVAPVAVTEEPKAEEPPPYPFSYTVRRGDTLSAIAVHCGSDTMAVALANKLPDPNTLSVDQILFVPCEIVWPVPVPVVELAPIGGAPSPRSTPNGGPTLDAVVAFALAQLGDWYVWGATGPDNWDCSGLMMGAYASQGIHITRTTYTQALVGRSIARAEVMPGDLIIFGASQGHVGMAISATEVVHAPQSGDQVKVTAIDYMGEINTIRRVLG